MTTHAEITTPTGAASRPVVLLAEVAVVVMALIWGINYSVIKYGTSAMTPVAFNGIRVAIAAFALLIIAVAWGGPVPARRDAIRLMALGVLGNGIYQLFFAEGIARTRAGEAALVVGASPALVAILGQLRGIERVDRRRAMGIAMSIAGVGLIVLGRATTGDVAGGGSLFGDLLVLAGSVCWALYTVLLIPFTKRVGGLWVISLSMLGGSTVLALVGAPAMLRVPWGDLGTMVWVSIFYGGLGGLVVAYLLWYRGVKILGPTRTALYANLQPMIALVVAWITLNEVPRTWQLVGAATIVGGVLLTRAPASEVS